MKRQIQCCLFSTLAATVLLISVCDVSLGENSEVDWAVYAPDGNDDWFITTQYVPPGTTIEVTVHKVGKGTRPFDFESIQEDPNVEEIREFHEFGSFTREDLLASQTNGTPLQCRTKTSGFILHTYGTRSGGWELGALERRENCHRIVFENGTVVELAVSLPKLSQESIRSLSEAQFKDGAVNFSPPKLFIRDRKVIWLGPRLHEDVCPRQHPAAPAIIAQYLVSAIRQSLDNEFWPTTLRQVESVIAEEIEYINRTPSPDQQILERFNERIEAIYEAAVKKYAVSKGMAVGKALRSLAPSPMRLDPDAPGTIYLISLAKFHVSQILYKRVPPLEQWTPYQPGTQAFLAGTYFYKISLPEGGMSAPRKTPSIPFSEQVTTLRLPL